MKKIFTLLVACLAAATLRALPADPRPRVVVQPDGSRITVRLCGDEYFHFLLSVDSIPLVEENGYHFYARPEGTAWISSGLRAADPDRRSAADLLFLRGIDRRAAVDSLCMQWRRQRDAMGALRRMPSPRRAPGEPQRAVPTKGSQRSLALLVTFPKTTDDGEATVFSVADPRQLFDDMLNKPGFDYDGATGSVKDYFRDASNGQYDITFDVFGPVELSKDISFYGQNFNGGDLNAWNMVVEACAQLDDQIDFTLYDSDRNGEVDNIYVFYAGLGEANGGERYTIWQHAGEVETLSGQQYIFDGVRVNRYACSNELRPITDEATGISSLHLEGIGVVVVEGQRVGVGPAAFRHRRHLGFRLDDPDDFVNDRAEILSVVAAERSGDVFPHSKSWIYSIGSTSHFFDNSDRFHKKPAARRLVVTVRFVLQSGSFPGDAQILARRTEGNNIHRLNVRAVDFRHITEVFHVRERRKRIRTVSEKRFGSRSWMPSVCRTI